MTNRQQEVELKLVAHDVAVLGEVAAYRELAGCSLRPAPTRALRDIYWDTPSGEVGAHGLSLRLRSGDGVEKFTLKGSGSLEQGLVRRTELELPATAENWSLIRAELANAGIQLPAPPENVGLAGNWLVAAGLQISQDRATQRRVLIAEQSGREVAELALDTTVYHVGHYDVTFREVEIEALTDDVQPVLALGEALQRAFPGRLSPSQRNKYARGLRLAALLALD